MKKYVEIHQHLSLFNCKWYIEAPYNWSVNVWVGQQEYILERKIHNTVKGALSSLQ